LEKNEFGFAESFSGRIGESAAILHHGAMFGAAHGSRAWVRA